MNIKRFINYIALFTVIFGACFAISAPVQAMEEAIQDTSNYRHSNDHKDEEPNKPCHDQAGANDTVLQNQTDNDSSTNILTTENLSSLPYFIEEKDDDNHLTQIDSPDLLFKNITTVRILI